MFFDQREELGFRECWDWTCFCEMNSKGAFGGRKSEEFRWILKGFRSVNLTTPV